MPINWKALKLKLGPTYEQQVTDVIQTFEEASNEGENATVEYMCREIEKSQFPNPLDAAVAKPVSKTILRQHDPEAEKAKQAVRDE